MKEIKVAHITTVDMSLRLLLLEQLQALQRNHFSIVGISSVGSSLSTIQKAGIHHISVPFSRNYSIILDVVCIVQLVRLFRKEKFVIAHTHTPKAGLLGQLAARIARIPIRIHTIHGLYWNSSMRVPQSAFYLAIERWTLRFANWVFSQNPEDTETAVKYRLCESNRIDTLGNGINLKTFCPDDYSKSDRNEFRAGLGLPANAIVIGMVGRFVEEKGYLDLLGAAQILKKQSRSIRFLLVGPLEPSKRDRLSSEIIDEYGLRDSVQYLGERNDMPALYSIMDIFALPSYREGFPRAAMEAAAMGLPLVLTNIRGCRQVVDPSVNGYLVPVKDPISLAGKLGKLIDDDGLRSKFGAQSRLKALAEFDQEMIFSKIIARYQELLASRSLQIDALEVVH